MKIPTNLTPFMRARLKLIKYLVYVALLNGFIALLSLISTGGKINMSTLWTAVGIQVILAVLLAIDKYFSAHLDPPLAVALDVATKQIEVDLHGNPATVAIPELPADIAADLTQQNTMPGPVLSGITASVGGAETLPRTPTVMTTIAQ